MKQTSLAAEQFGATAHRYLTSAVHAHGADLERLTALARQRHRPSVLDLGCGAGHAAFAMARGGARVTAYDLSPDMLRVVEEEAGRRGIAGLHTRQGPAEHLPFADASFDVVATRFSAHHWADVGRALDEVRRVLRAGGSLVVIDVVAPETPLLDTVLQTVELLRDASHVRDYRASEWTVMLREAGFGIPQCETWKLRMEFETWVTRMRTPDVRVHAIRDVLAHAVDEVKRYFSVGNDGSFDIDIAWMETGAPTSYS
ncbi:MAG: class I SAM-dependent methyltransferase [Rhodospirillaceae bacterium]